MNTDHTISTLNDLIEVSKDGEYGFRTSAEYAKDPQLKQTLTVHADECALGVRELQKEIVALGGSADDSGSAAGAMHRGWVAVKSTLSNYEDREILEEVERGEDRALHRYRKAAAQELAPSARAIVERQLEGVQRNHDQIRALRNAARERTSDR